MQRKAEKRLARQGAAQTDFREGTVSKPTTPSQKQKVVRLPVRSPPFHPETPTRLDARPRSRRSPTEESSPPAPKVYPPNVSAIADALASPDVARRHVSKRKILEKDEELPSSSPPQQFGPSKRIRHEDPHGRREIPSTPDRSPLKSVEGKYSPLFVQDADEELEDAPSNNDGAQDKHLPQSEESEGDVDYPSIAALSENLSEPKRGRGHTQAIFGEATPFIDFEIPPPEEGWKVEEEHIKREESEGEEASTVTVTEAYRSTVPDTQAIFRDASQIPDFELPDPEGGWKFVPPSSPPREGSPEQRAESRASSNDPESQIDQWEAKLVAKGFSLELVQQVLNCTTLDMTLAEQVLESLRKGKRKSGSEDPNGVPDDWPGVWTAADDEDLDSTDARTILRVQEKHGKKLFNSRVDYRQFLKQNA